MVRARLIQRKRKLDGKVQTSPFWHLRYSIDGGAETTINLKVEDKLTAEKLRVAFVSEKEREAAGILAPKLMRDSAQRELSEHLAEFTADLRARGLASMYVYNIDKHVAKLIEECGWRYARDVTADSFVAWRGRQKLAGRTLNQYLDDVCNLLGWMKRQGRIADNPLVVVRKVNTARVESKRRAFTVAELQALVFRPLADDSVCSECQSEDATKQFVRVGRAANSERLSPVKAQIQKQPERITGSFRPGREARSLSGSDGEARKCRRCHRRVVYLAACTTALRRNELRQLRWSDLYLDASPPYVSVRASTTKNARSAKIRLVPVLVRELLKMRAGISKETERVFRRIPWMEEFRADLEAAGVDHRPNAEGKALVFHSLRYSVSTVLLNAGVAPRVVMEVMRHSDIKLTTKTYTDVSQLATGDAFAELSRLLGVREPVKEVQRAPEVDTPVDTTFRGVVYLYGAEFHTDSEAAFREVWRKQGVTGDSVEEFCMRWNEAESWGTRIRT